MPASSNAAANNLAHNQERPSETIAFDGAAAEELRTVLVLTLDAMTHSEQAQVEIESAQKTNFNGSERC